MRIILITIVILLQLCNNILAQTVKLNDDGIKIVQFPDETWHFFDINNPDDINLEKNIGDENWCRALRLKNKAKISLQNAQDELDATKMKINAVQEDLIDAEAPDSNISKGDIKKMKSMLENFKTELKKNKKDVEIATEDVKVFDELLSMNKEKRDNVFVALDDKEKKDNSQKENNIPSENNETPIVKKEMEAKDFAKPLLKDNVLYNPPSVPCNVVFDGVDPFTGKNRKEIAKELFFVHTDDLLKPYFNGDNYITCEGQVIRTSNGLAFLVLYITIKSTDAQRGFGMLETNSLLTIKLIDGSTITLLNNHAELGTIDRVNGTTIYTVQYSIPHGAVKILKQKEIDRVRISWSPGYEDYDVYNVDFLMHQLNCLEAK